MSSKNLLSFTLRSAAVSALLAIPVFGRAAGGSGAWDAMAESVVAQAVSVDFSDLTSQITDGDSFESADLSPMVYSTTVGAYNDGNGTNNPKLSVLYNKSTGTVRIESGPPDVANQFKSLSIKSATGALIMNKANWLSNAPGTSLYSNTSSTQGFGSGTALGHTFLIADGYQIGAILAPNLSLAFLLANLTITYGAQGQIGTLTGDLIYVVPEPSTLVLMAIGLVGAGLCYRRRAAA